MPVSSYFKGGGSQVMSNMKKEYGAKKGKSVFYATANKNGQKPDAKAAKPAKKKGPADGTSRPSMRGLLAALLLCLVSVPAFAQEPAGLPTAQGRQVAHVGSWITVLSAEALDVWATVHADDVKHAVVMHAIRLGAVEGAVFGLKKAFPDARPCTPTHTCGSDSEMSGFPSGHMALACSTLGGPSLSVSIPLMAGTGLGRNLAGRHFIRQIGAGCLVGALGALIR